MIRTHWKLQRGLREAECNSLNRNLVRTQRLIHWLQGVRNIVLQQTATNRVPPNPTLGHWFSMDSDDRPPPPESLVPLSAVSCVHCSHPHTDPTPLCLTCKVATPIMLF